MSATKPFIRVVLGLAAICAALPAAAENLALILTNQRYQDEPAMWSGVAVEGLGADLQSQGWTVIMARDATAPEMWQAARDLREAMRDSNGADRVIIAAAGQMARQKDDLWLLGRFADKPDHLSVGSSGISLNVLAEIAQMAAGQAVMLIADAEREPELGPGLRPQAGSIAPPQGVLVVTGQMGGLRRWTRDTLLVPGRTFNQALQELPRDAQAVGFRPSGLSFVPQVQEGGGAGPVAESAYWSAIRDIGTREAFETYLDRYPTGRFAGEARDRVAALTRSPADIAQEAEAALGLSRDARRQIQRDLALLGHDPRGIDGIFGRGSRAAIQAWQRANGLPDTGFLTSDQVTALRLAAANRAAVLEREARLRREAEEREDRALWRQLGRDEASLRLYLERYPDGLFSETAQDLLNIILRERMAAAEARERAAWNRAQEQNTIQAYRAFLADFPDGSFAAEAKTRIAELRAEAENAEVIKQLRAQEAQILPNSGARLLVEKILQDRGYEPGEVDGEFTRETRRAIRRFQRQQNLPVNGFVTQNTMVVLMLSRR